MLLKLNLYHKAVALKYFKITARYYFEKKTLQTGFSDRHLIYKTITNIIVLVATKNFVIY